MITCRNVSKAYGRGGHRNFVFRDVDFEVAHGDRIALLGRNGAGKSTLIRLIGGVEMPTSGRIARNMSVSWPLGFTGGFQGSMTGYDNARFIARIYGQDYARTRAFVEEFTELGAQLRKPVKTYSSGMRARLAFALSLSIEFECYLIDEIILVGDQNFQRKCMVELFEKRNDRTMILASHSNEFVQQFCTRALVLQSGRAVPFDDVAEAVAAYSAL
ncbi:ABC transporter ATP-binding protein [Sphingomonas pokkalii]|uniref:ATP-binding protein n=1 Tax=Sphingomonas pokkalii TaxID=2175090 RepID=A0A2U0SAL5_9SPHN|nr:ABC transporter ATP-binding protein [Sphingomonas pokkalii]PVX28418.1 ATP-binding protein [Sphingomonas pokkalii]